MAKADKGDQMAANCAAEYFAKEYEDKCAGNHRDCTGLVLKIVAYYEKCWKLPGDYQLRCAYYAGYNQALHDALVHYGSGGSASKRGSRHRRARSGGGTAYPYGRDGGYTIPCAGGMCMPN
jgi:hypothetical protein